MTPAELKTLREACGLPQSWLAHQAQVNERTVRYWESGKSSVPDDVAALISRIDAQLDTVQHALGVNMAISKVHGSRLKAQKEIRIASTFKQAPEAFLQTIVVHELAHLRERNHDKAFYRLCQHMLPDYHQREFDLRVWLMAQELNQA